MFPTFRQRLRAALIPTLVGLLLCSLPACKQEPQIPKEQQLAAVLKTLRDGLSGYAKKEGRFPRSLEELVASGIIREIPLDPVSNSRSTWTLVREESVTVTDFSSAPAAEEEVAPIVDIRSGASGTDARGVPWSEY